MTSPSFKDAASHEAYEAAQLLMDGLSTLNGSLRVRDGRNDWMRDFSAALAGDFAKLSRLLLALEKNLPWKAMKEGFEKARPDFLARLAAVTTPAQAARELKQITKDIRPEHWLKAFEPSGLLSSADRDRAKDDGKFQDNRGGEDKEGTRRKSEGLGEAQEGARNGGRQGSDRGKDKLRQHEREKTGSSRVAGGMPGMPPARAGGEKRTSESQEASPCQIKRPCMSGSHGFARPENVVPGLSKKVQLLAVVRDEHANEKVRKQKDGSSVSNMIATSSRRRCAIGSAASTQTTLSGMHACHTSCAGGRSIKAAKANAHESKSTVAKTRKETREDKCEGGHKRRVEACLDEGTAPPENTRDASVPGGSQGTQSSGSLALCGSSGPASAEAAAAAAAAAAFGGENKQGTGRHGHLIEMLHTEAFANGGRFSVRKGRVAWLKDYKAALADRDPKRLRKNILQLEKNLSWKAMNESFVYHREALIESARRVGSGEEAEQILSGLASFIHPEFFLKRLPGKMFVSIGGAGSGCGALSGDGESVVGMVGMPCTDGVSGAAMTARSALGGDSNPPQKRRVKRQATWLVPPSEFEEAVMGRMQGSMQDAAQLCRARSDQSGGRETERDRYAVGSDNSSSFSSFSSPAMSSCIPTPTPFNPLTCSLSPSTPPLRTVEKERRVKRNHATDEGISVVRGERKVTKAAGYADDFVSADQNVQNLSLGRRVLVEVKQGAQEGERGIAVAHVDDHCAADGIACVGVITQRLAGGKFRISFRHSHPDMDIRLPSPHVRLC